MRFLHIADLHLGKVVHGTSMLENGDQPYWAEKFLELTREEAPDAVLISGDVYDAIEQGMIGAAETAMPGEYDLNRLGFQVAIKTGTPQSPRGTDSFVIGYAPADDPEIAFCAMIEGGKNAKYMVRDILQLYARYYPDTKIGRSMN